MWSLSVGEETGQCVPVPESLGSQTPLPLFLPLLHFLWVAFHPSGGHRSLSPRGWGAKGSHQWQWLPSRLGSRWEK